jgi:succinoglycan biosynthesis transport protein ExoP
MDVRGYLALLGRRKWIIIPFLIFMPLATYIYAAQGTAVYEASAQVFLNRQSQALSGLDDPLILQPERVIRTQADIARLPVIAERVVDEAGLTGRTPRRFLKQSSVSANEQVDLLTFRVRDEVPSRATRLANLYATKYIEFRRELDTKALREASQAVRAQIETLEDKGLLVNSGLYSALAQKLQQLQSAQVLQQSNALLVREASQSDQVEPRPMQMAVLALGLAGVLGLALAFLVDALDTRVRDPEQLADTLGLPLLGSLPEPPRALRNAGRVVMLEDPNSASAEPYRMLRTSLEVTALATGCRSIMVTSALAQEGKSTTAANLAIALARAGRHVVLVDLDLRRPALDRFFELQGRPGITDLVHGRSSIGDAGVRHTFGDAFAPPFRGDLRVLQGGEMDTGNDREPGILDVIGSGSLPPNPGEFVVTSELDAALARLQEGAELIIVDGPPLLLAGDALTLSAKVDGLLLVTRMNTLRRGQIGELERVLAASPTVKLGVVATDHTAMSKRAYYGAAMWAARQEERSRSRPGRTPAEGGRAYTDDTNDLLPELEDEDRGESAAARRSWT